MTMKTRGRGRGRRDKRGRKREIRLPKKKVAGTIVFDFGREGGKRKRS